MNSAEEIHKQDDADTPPRASVKDSGVTRMGAGYEVYTKQFLLLFSLWFILALSVITKMVEAMQWDE